VNRGRRRSPTHAVNRDPVEDCSTRDELKTVKGPTHAVNRDPVEDCSTRDELKTVKESHAPRRLRR
jgi:hypothetical protein